MTNHKLRWSRWRSKHQKPRQRQKAELKVQMKMRQMSLVSLVVGRNHRLPEEKPALGTCAVWLVQAVSVCITTEWGSAWRLSLTEYWTVKVGCKSAWKEEPTTVRRTDACLQGEERQVWQEDVIRRDDLHSEGETIWWQKCPCWMVVWPSLCSEGRGQWRLSSTVYPRGALSDWSFLEGPWGISTVSGLSRAICTPDLYLVSWLAVVFRLLRRWFLWYLLGWAVFFLGRWQWLCAAVSGWRQVGACRCRRGCHMRCPFGVHVFSYVASGCFLCPSLLWFSARRCCFFLQLGGRSWGSICVVWPFVAPSGSFGGQAWFVFSVLYSAYFGFVASPPPCGRCFGGLMARNPASYVSSLTLTWDEVRELNQGLKFELYI